MSFLLLLLCASLSAASPSVHNITVVIVPVADVWSRPIAPAETPTDNLRETQVLMGEKVITHESRGAWVRISAIEQLEYTHRHRWEGYPGWILRNSLGPQASTPQASTFKGTTLDFAGNAIGTPYLWGGLTQIGYDCSGLIYRAYRETGRLIPRDAYEQWMKAKHIKRAALQPMDLIFSAKADHPKMITHVAMYAGHGDIIEAPQAAMAVRKISFQEKYGKPLDDVQSGDRVGDRYVYFGRLPR